MTVAAIILARGGSKGIPNKNLQKIGGMTLVERAIVSVQNTKNIQDIFVSSDSKLILAEAKEKGANIIVRPDNISQDHSSSESGWLQAIEEIQKQNNEFHVKIPSFFFLALRYKIKHQLSYFLMM